MQDQQDEGKAQGSFTPKYMDMQDSTLEEDTSPASNHTDRKAASDVHPKKKRKVNHGQNILPYIALGRD